MNLGPLKLPPERVRVWDIGLAGGLVRIDTALVNDDDDRTVGQDPNQGLEQGRPRRTSTRAAAP